MLLLGDMCQAMYMLCSVFLINLIVRDFPTRHSRSAEVNMFSLSLSLSLSPCVCEHTLWVGLYSRTCTRDEGHFISKVSKTTSIPYLVVHSIMMRMIYTDIRNIINAQLIK